FREGFRLRESCALSRHAQVRNLIADLCESGGNLARTRQIEVLRRVGGAALEDGGVALGAANVDEDRINDDAVGLGIVADGAHTGIDLRALVRSITVPAILGVQAVAEDDDVARGAGWKRAGIERSAIAECMPTPDETDCLIG